jgi:ATP-binding cassette, subfamily B, bacterial
MNLILRYLAKHKRLLFLALFLASINNLFSLLDPQIARLLLDQYITKATQMPADVFVRGVGLLLLAGMGVALVSRVAKSFQDYYVNVVTRRVGTEMYAEAVDHAFSLPYFVFEDQRSGELLQKLQKARTDTQTFITGVVNVVFFSFIGILFVLSYAAFVHWSIALAFALAIPTLGGATFWISSRIKAASQIIVRETAELSGSTTETLRNVELVKSLGLEEQETRRLNEVNEKILGLELKKVKTVRALSFIQGTLINTLRSAIMLLLLWLIYTGKATIGEYFSLLFYSFFVFGPLGELGTIAQQYQEARAANETLEEVFKIKSEPKPAHPVAIGALADIRFSGVTFNYQSSETPSVNELDFEIKSGETVAFVGPSGAGKSTIIKLLVGLYRATGGEIRINGVKSSEIDFDDFRRRIGYVSQETQLFAGTIRENLLFVNPKATDDQCLEAIRHAAATNIIERGGKGLDTKIGEGGIKISGGERQRLAIARALLRDPELIIFDEATSSLDSLTEKSITETIRNISKLRPNLMTVLVAHRLSTVAHADTIYVLEKGSLSEAGAHADLLKKNGLYFALWREQGAADDSHRLLTGKK